MKHKLNVYRLKLDAPDVIVPCGDNAFLIGAFTVISGYEKDKAICICYANDKKVNDGFSVSADYFEKVTNTEITYDDEVPECLFTQKEITTEQARKINGYLSKICADTAVFRMFHKKDVDEAVNHILKDAYNSVKAVLLGKGYDKPTEELLRKIDGGKVDSDAAESEKVLIKDPIRLNSAEQIKALEFCVKYLVKNGNWFLFTMNNASAEKMRNEFYEKIGKTDIRLCDLGICEGELNFRNRKENNKKGDTDIFYSILKEMAETHKAKNHDYGNSFSKLFDKCGMTYAYGHLAEKLERIDTLRTQENKVKSESMLDSLYDLANYCVMTIVELKKQQKV